VAFYLGFICLAGIQELNRSLAL